MILYAPTTHLEVVGKQGYDFPLHDRANLETYWSSLQSFNICCITYLRPLTALLFRAYTLDICLIFKIFWGIFRFKVASMFFGATMFNVMSETSFLSSEIRLHTMRLGVKHNSYPLRLGLYFYRLQNTGTGRVMGH